MDLRLHSSDPPRLNLQVNTAPAWRHARRLALAAVLALLLLRIVALCRWEAPGHGHTAQASRQYDDRIAATRIPPQELFVAGQNPPDVEAFYQMADPYASDAIVQDISAQIEANAWRWAYETPILQFHVPDFKAIRFVMQFAFPGVVYDRTGPATLTCTINHHLLTKVSCPKPGLYEIDLAVPRDWLAGSTRAIVVAVLDQHLKVDGDPRPYTYILQEAGFREGGEVHPSTRKRSR